MLQLIKLTDNLVISGQPSVDQIEQLVAQDVKVVVCNRPDGETEGQPSSSQIAAAAEAAGMRFVMYPVNPQTFPGDDLRSLGALFDGEEKVFAYCRTGTRCANLWVASRAADEREAAIETARSFGYDLALSARLS